MGQSKLKKAHPRIGGSTAANGGQIGTAPNAPPHGNTGGNLSGESEGPSGQTVAERGRVTISPSSGLHAALAGAAESLGMPVSQVALAAVMAGLPALLEQVRAARELSQ